MQIVPESRKSEIIKPESSKSDMMLPQSNKSEKTEVVELKKLLNQKVEAGSGYISFSKKLNNSSDHNINQI